MCSLWKGMVPANASDPCVFDPSSLVAGFLLLVQAGSTLPNKKASFFCGSVRAAMQKGPLMRRLEKQKTGCRVHMWLVSISALKSCPDLSECICFGHRQLGYANMAGMSLWEGDAQIYFQAVHTRLCLDVFGFECFPRTLVNFYFCWEWEKLAAVHRIKLIVYKV